VANTKKYLVIGIGIAIVIALGASFTSYIGQFEQQTQTNQTEGEILSLKAPPVLGSETASVTIIEMGDYQCEMCKRWYDNTRPKIIENFIDTGKANLIFIDLPILGYDSHTAAEATYCADDQDMYWDYHATLYDYQGHMNSGWANSERLKAFAFNLGLNMDEFEECLDSGKYEKRIKFNSEKAKSSGANSTPNFVIVNSSGEQQKIRGAQPYTVFEQVIESLL
jgi:protein-disulfide isomerase